MGLKVGEGLKVGFTVKDESNAVSGEGFTGSLGKEVTNGLAEAK